MFYQIFLSPQVKRCPIITYKHGTYELQNDSTLKKLGNITKLSNDSPAPSPPPKTKAPPTLEENPPKKEINPPQLCATPHENQSQPQIPRNPPQKMPQH